MTRPGRFAHRLYRGELSYDFVGRWRRWFAISGVVIVVAIVALSVKWLTLSLDFKGGTQFIVTKPGISLSAAQADVAKVPGLDNPSVQTLGSGKATVTLGGSLAPPDTNRITNDLAQQFGVTPDTVTSQSVSGSWGSQVSQKALLALIIFLVAVMIYLVVLFEWKMALAAIVALLHDLVITVGIYSLVGFEVSPATVTGLLTILGYSLYDTVVIFDKVRENTRDLKTSLRGTYSQAANLAVNQSLVRSINTSTVALLPVAALLFVGAGLGAAQVLKDLSLALLVGIAAGTYSSIFVATPLLALMKERERDMRALAKRIAAREASRAKEAALRAKKEAEADAAAQAPEASPPPAAAGAGTGAVPVGAAPVGSGARRPPPDRTPRPRSKPKGRQTGKRRR